MNTTGKNRFSRSQKPYSGSRTARQQAKLMASSAYLLPRVVLVGIFLTMSLMTLWLLMTDEPWLALFAAFGAAITLGRDTMRNLAKSKAALVSANGCPHSKYVAWEFRHREDALL